jgi:hypothetical protein
VDYEQRSDPEVLQLRIGSGDRLLVVARHTVRDNVDALCIDSEQFEYFVGRESAGGDYRRSSPRTSLRAGGNLSLIVKAQRGKIVHCHYLRTLARRET